MRKPTIQSIADNIGVSRITVWKAMNGRDGVSDAVRQKILLAALEAGYTLSPELADQIRPSQEEVRPQRLNISVVVARPESSEFWMTILHELAICLADESVNLIYTYVPYKSTGTYDLPSKLTDGSIDGMIVFNVYDPVLVSMLSALAVPKVFLDIPPAIRRSEVKGDIVLTSGRNAVGELTEHLIRRGKKRIGFIGDISYALTNWERYQGYCQTMEQFDLPVDNSFCLTGSIEVDSYIPEIYSFIQGLDVLPEAFVCVSDFVANIVWNALEEQGYRVPKDILLTGFDGQTITDSTRSLSTVAVSCKDLGICLADQLLYRMRKPYLHPQVIYIGTEVRLGGSTGD